MDEPIITSLLDTDFYKFTMAQVVWRRHAGVPVMYGFKNRTSSVRLADIVDAGELREQLEHVRSLRFSEDELDFLRESPHLPFGMFESDFLDFLGSLHLPEARISVEDGQFVIRAEGPWSQAIFWETFILSIVNELCNRAILGGSAHRELEAVDQGWKRLISKADVLMKEAPGARIIEFGTRRRFSGSWQTQVALFLRSRLGDAGMLAGTSNIALARLLGIPPIGTMAHEMYMVYSGIYHDSDDQIRASHNKVLQSWWHEYGIHLSIALTDTYGSEFFFKDMTQDQARNWRGLRQDSGDPFAFGERAIEFYKGHGIDPAEKLVVFSDGLDVEKIIALHKRFDGRIKTSFGWGTDLTNDCGVSPLSMVVKAVRSCGHPTVKLSDNLAKATGPDEEVERFKRIFGYTGDSYEACRV